MSRADGSSAVALPPPAVDVPAARRIYVCKGAYHLYYEFDEDEVIVRALWAARPRRGPHLNP